MLARDLGLTVEELLTRVTVAEYQGWITLYELEAKEQQDALRKMKARRGRRG